MKYGKGGHNVSNLYVICKKKKKHKRNIYSDGKFRNTKDNEQGGSSLRAGLRSPEGT